MLVQSFIRWSETATAGERARAAAALGHAYGNGRMSGDERRAAEAAMALLLEDPSPKVRISLADAIAAVPYVPRSLVLALAHDQIEVAGRVIALSPALTDGDLVDLVASGRACLQQLAAYRRPLSAAVCAAIAEVGCEAAVGEMLDNPAARLAGISLKRLAERFGRNPEIRMRLLERPDLPPPVRQTLVEHVGAALAGCGFARSAVGGERLRRITEEACRDATLQLTENVPASEMPALVEHLRMAGRLTPAFLMHGLCAGNVDFFAAAVISLSGIGDRRVRGILVEGREAAMRALYRACGLAAGLVPVFVSATLMWREASRAPEQIDASRIARRLIRQHAAAAAADPAVADLLRLVETMQMRWLRRASRDYAQRLAADAA